MSTKQNIITHALSDNQQGIFFEVMRNSHPIYISQMCLIFRGSFNYKLFQKAYHLIIKRHEILRSAIIMDRASAGIFSLQSIYPQVNPIMAFYDYENLPPQQKNKLFKLFLNDDFLTPFNFNIPPLMRLTTIRFSDQEHRIIWTRHHILLDGASVALILSELLTIYSALLHNMSWQLPICYSYHDIKEKLCLKDRIKAALYWKKQLNLFSESALLPAIPQNNTTTNNFSQLQSELGGDDYQILLAFVDRWELTINSILQAAWGIVLSHYSNNRHVIFGSVRAYPKEETADAVGLFINTLPLSLTINPNSVVVDYLRAVREQGKALREYVHTPLSDLREWCGLALDEMLYQSIVDYKPYSLNKLIKTQFSDMNCESSLRLTIPYPLVIEGVNEDSCLNLSLNYSTDLFIPQFAENILAHFKDMIKKVCLYPLKTISELPTLTTSDFQKSVINWNNTEHTYPLEKTLHQLFEEQVKKTPKAPALLYKNKILTYEALNNKANQLAHYLLSQKIIQETLIIILVKPNINMIISILAVLKAGAAYVPVDISYPLERIKYLINTSGSMLIINDTKTKPFIDELVGDLNRGVTFINVDRVSYHTYSFSNPTISLSSSNLAYMIYTSGSTGFPKGVLVEHCSVINMALGVIERLQITSESRVLQIASFSFDVAVAEWSLALLSGASLCLIDKEIFDPAEIVAAMKFYKISTIILASSILTALPREEIGSLKVIAVGGEACSQAVIDFWANKRLFLNVYGITEATVCSTIANCYPNQIALSIGRPLPNTQIYLLNEEHQPLPIGVCGEIYIGGIGVARGYCNNVYLSQEKFIVNPFLEHVNKNSSIKTNRLYKTGDKGRWLHNGELEFLGRKDTQIKIMGIRIELMEIEHAIEHHPTIEKAAVILNKDNSQLLAFLLPKLKTTLLDLDDLRYFLKTKLPHALIPNQFVVIDKFPLTSNGKIDKEQLIKYQPLIEDTIDTERDQLTATEDIILSTIKKITGFRTVSLNQNFLDIGLKSLNLVEMSIELTTLVKHEVSVITLFSYTTIKTLANYIDNLKLKLETNESGIFSKRSSRPRHKIKSTRIGFNNERND